MLRQLELIAAGIVLAGVVLFFLPFTAYITITQGWGLLLFPVIFMLDAFLLTGIAAFLPEKYIRTRWVLTLLALLTQLFFGYYTFNLLPISFAITIGILLMASILWMIMNSRNGLFLYNLTGIIAFILWYLLYVE